jgi:hypothetical protein
MAVVTVERGGKRSHVTPGLLSSQARSVRERKRWERQQRHARIREQQHLAQADPSLAGSGRNGGRREAVGQVSGSIG